MHVVLNTCGIVRLEEGESGQAFHFHTLVLCVGIHSSAQFTALLTENASCVTVNHGDGSWLCS